MTEPMSTNQTYRAIVLQVDMRTETGRVYPKAVVQQAVQEYNERIRANTAFGLCLKSDERNQFEAGTLPLDRVSHRMTECTLADDRVVVALEVLDTPRGAILRDWLQKGELEPWDLAPCGLGHVKEDGTVHDYHLISFDFVEPEAEPATPAGEG